MSSLAATAGAVFGFLAVALGAFGSHALREHFTPSLQSIYNTAIQYGFYHSLALLALAVLSRVYPDFRAQIPIYAFIAGIIIFSGSLILLTLTGTRMWGALTPIGGIAFLLGWGAIIWSGWRGAFS
jgi:uncharacterized membrane protein YgdD (TMEM256/DUF423 family)